MISELYYRSKLLRYGGAIIIGIVIFSIFYIMFNFLNSAVGEKIPLLEGLLTETLGIVITLLIIERIIRIQNEFRERDRLVRRVGSSSNETAKSALDELRKSDWLSRGILRNTDLSGANLQYANLKDVDLSGANLTDANLSHANLENANLSGANLTDTDLNYAILAGAKFKEAKLINTTFHHASMGGVNLTGADIKGAEFHHTDMEKANFGAADDDYDTNHTKNIGQAEFHHAELIAICFDGMNLDLGDFTGADLTDSTFRGTSLESTKLEKAVLRRCEFSSKANLENLTLTEAKCHDAQFKDCIMRGSSLIDAIFRHSTFKNVDMTRTIISHKTSFERASFFASDLSDQKLHRQKSEDDTEEMEEIPFYANRLFDIETEVEFEDHETKRNYNVLFRRTKVNHTSLHSSNEDNKNQIHPFENAEWDSESKLPDGSPYSKDNLQVYLEKTFPSSMDDLDETDSTNEDELDKSDSTDILSEDEYEEITEKTSLKKLNLPKNSRLS